MNLALEHHPHWPRASLDSENAYCKIARVTIAMIFQERYQATGHEDHLRALRLFLILYSTPGLALIMTGIALHMISVTDGIDQGGPMGNIYFGVPIGVLVTRLFNSTSVPVALALIVDDLTFACPIHHQGVQYVFCTLLKRVITLLRKALRLNVVPRKSFVFQVPEERHLAIAMAMHLLPPEFKRVDTAYRLAGGPVGTLAGRLAFLLDLVKGYKATVTRFINIPRLHAHGVLLAFTVCSRPSTRFNHHLRVILPTVAT